MGIVEQSEGIVFLSQPPAVIKDGSLSSQRGVFVIEELRSGLELPSDTPVTFTNPGLYQHGFNGVVDPPTIPSGTVIRSYLIHVDCDSNEQQSRQGRVAFDGEILGVVTDPRQWGLFAQLAPGKACRVELEPGVTSLVEDHSKRKDKNKQDWIRLSEDGRSIDFSLCVSGNAFDAFRVLVAMPDRPKPAAGPAGGPAGGAAESGNRRSRRGS